MAFFSLIDGKFPDYYQILGVPHNATGKHILHSFKHLAITHHPDENYKLRAATEPFTVINQEKDILQDKDIRKQYTDKLATEDEKTRATSRETIEPEWLAEITQLTREHIEIQEREQAEKEARPQPERERQRRVQERGQQ
jgi:DnaJ-class molecular chaperone